MTKLRPFYEESHAIYDISDEFFALFLDPTMTYTCAYFERDDMTLEEAQNATLDLALNKLNLERERRCSTSAAGGAGRWSERWRSTTSTSSASRSAAISPSTARPSWPVSRPNARWRRGCRAGKSSTRKSTGSSPSRPSTRSRRSPKYPAFFERAYEIMPDDGRMLLHSIFMHPWTYWHEHGIPVTMSDLRFMRFIQREIFPGGQLPAKEDILEFSQAGGFPPSRSICCVRTMRGPWTPGRPICRPTVT